MPELKPSTLRLIFCISFTVILVNLYEIMQVIIKHTNINVIP